MKLVLSLRVRTLLFSFLPLSLALIASFFAISAALKDILKDRLRRSLHRTEVVVEQARDDYQRRNLQLIASLGENAGLKAAMGLSIEGLAGPEAQVQIRRTIEDTLRDLGSRLDYDLLAVADQRGRALAAVTRQGEAVEVAAFPEFGPGSRLMRIAQDFYQTTATRVQLGDETLGVLLAGRRLNLQTFLENGDLALVSGGQVLATTFNKAAAASLERALARAGAAGIPDETEIRLNGEPQLVIRLRRAAFGPDYQLLSFRSLDQALREYTTSFRRILLLVGVCGVLVAAVLGALASKSTAQPLSDLVHHLQGSERTGTLRADFQTRSSVWEVNELAQAFNRAAGAISDSQGRLDRAYLEFTETMAQALDARDPYTAGHSSRVCAYSLAIAQAMGLSASQIETLRVGAELHDIGKIGIPDAILQKAGPLTREEFGLIKLHPQIGKKILEKVEKFKSILPIVELHHEDFDGRGYPYGQKGADTPLLARIVRVADTYDAMSTNRAYRKALDLEKIVGQLVSGKGRQFDPEIVDVWLSILSERDKNEAFHSFELQAGGHIAAIAGVGEFPLAGAGG